MNSSEHGDPRSHALYLHLVEVHKIYRRELTRLREEMAKLPTGSGISAFPRDMRLRDLRLNCMQFCDALRSHHSVEDGQMFPQLRQLSPAAGPIVDRLESEHRRIAELVSRLENTVTSLARDPSSIAVMAKELTELGDDLEAHLDNEENSLLEVLGSA
ncbi:hypothetical protein ALI144C_00205 [Actinosynnema sp. ALI-1.44]|uniref:hemerythrin domain-containing protein n=1 Tax=Actinosynnema sp. ALI-1.44 TaxID=1933779 RepID=UPI00097C3242|nr:hemerythrin domain-containing protein [Actinosynnema sp. ALI-1.44]ONI91985.1 hypothetical protein ALI144C_00205 [Actinosynnema sp. ALI-1.44]